MDDEVEYAPGDGYEPRPPKGPPELPSSPASGVVPTAIFQTPMIADPEDRVGARCGATGPTVKAEGKTVNLPCIRHRDHVNHGSRHRAFQGDKPEARVWYEW